MLHVSPTQLIMLQGCGPCCPSRIISAADNLVEGPVDGCRRCSFLTLTELFNFQASQCKHRASPAPACYLKMPEICLLDVGLQRSQVSTQISASVSGFDIVIEHLC